MNSCIYSIYSKASFSWRNKAGRSRTSLKYFFKKVILVFVPDAACGLNGDALAVLGLTGVTGNVDLFGV